MLPLTCRKCADVGNVCFRYYLHPKLHSPACFRLTLHHARFFPVIEYTSFCCCSVTKSCLTLCDSMNCSIAGFPVLHYLPEFAQTPVHWVSDAIQLSHPLSPPSSFALSLSPSIRVFSSTLALHIRWLHHSPKHPFGKMVSNFKNNNKNKYTGDSCIK